MNGYKGAPKRWVEGLYAGSYRPGETGIEVRCSFFKRFLGCDNVMVPNVGFRTVAGRRWARPLIVATDLLEGVLDAKGRQIPGKSNGLYYPGLPDPDTNEPTLKPLVMFLKRVGEERFLTLLPGDQHENPDAFERNTLSTTVLDPDLTKLSERERATVHARYLNWVGKRLPLGIWQDLFMAATDPLSQGRLIGKEERNFVPHCTEFVVRYIQPAQDLIDRQKAEIARAVAAGEMVPAAHVLPIAKDGLTVDLPDDERGMGGNKFDTLLKAAFTGDYFQGDDHRHQKRAVVVGACSEYSVRLAIEHLIDADINVVWLLTCSKGLDLFSSKLHEAHYLMERYGKKLFCTYDWIEELFGPKPAGWDEAQSRVMAMDRAQHAAWWKEFEKQMAAATTSLGGKVFMSGREVAEQLMLPDPAKRAA